MNVNPQDIIPGTSKVIADLRASEFSGMHELLYGCLPFGKPEEIQELGSKIDRLRDQAASRDKARLAHKIDQDRLEKQAAETRRLEAEADAAEEQHKVQEQEEAEQQRQDAARARLEDVQKRDQGAKEATELKQRQREAEKDAKQRQDAARLAEAQAAAATKEQQDVDALQKARIARFCPTLPTETEYLIKHQNEKLGLIAQLSTAGDKAGACKDLTPLIAQWNKIRLITIKCASDARSANENEFSAILLLKASMAKSLQDDLEKFSRENECGM